MRFERSQRSDQDPGGCLLTHSPAIPTLLQGPLLQRLLPSDHMPYARTAGGTKAADGNNRIPNNLTRVLDSRTGPARRSKAGPIADPRPRYVEGPQRVELRDGKTISKILTGLSHSCCNRAASFHHREGVDKTIGPARAAGSIADCLLYAFNKAVLAPFRRWDQVGACRVEGFTPNIISYHPIALNET